MLMSWWCKKITNKNLILGKTPGHYSKVPYQSAMGSLMYAMVCTRPDIAYAVGVVSRFMTNPGEAHWNAVKWILRYLKGTSRSFICFGSGDPVLQAYTNADYVGDEDSRKSSSGYLMTYAGGAVAIKIAEMCFTVNHRCWVHCSSWCLQGSVVDEELLARVGHEAREVQFILW